MPAARTHTGDTRKFASPNRPDRPPPTKNAKKTAPAVMKVPEAHVERPLLLGAAAEPAAPDDLLVHQPLDEVEGGLEPVLQLGQRHPVAAGEHRVEEGLLVGGEGGRTGGRRRAGEHPVVGAEHALVVAGDLEVAADGEVDEGGGDVDEVDLLVEDRADHPGLDPGRGVELDGDRGLRTADDDRGLLGRDRAGAPG